MRLLGRLSGAIKMTRTFNVLKTLGGCGGTIVSRALAASGALVLSEVNPRSANLFAGALNPIVQMNRDHFDLLPEAWRGVDVHTLGAPNVFGAFMAALTDALEQPLLIRDYSYIDYIGVPFLWPRPVQACLSHALKPFGMIRSALLVRHPYHCLRSLLTHPPLADVLTPEDFVAGHIAFHEDNRNVPLFRYEDFIAAPERVVKALRGVLGLSVERGWSERLAEVTPLTGHRRAIDSTEIAAPLDRHDPELVARLEAVPGYEHLLELGGYAPKAALTRPSRASLDPSPR